MHFERSAATRSTLKMFELWSFKVENPLSAGPTATLNSPPSPFDHCPAFVTLETWHGLTLCCFSSSGFIADWLHYWPPGIEDQWDPSDVRCSDQDCQPSGRVHWPPGHYNWVPCQHQSGRVPDQCPVSNRRLGTPPGIHFTAGGCLAINPKCCCNCLIFTILLWPLNNSYWKTMHLSCETNDCSS